MVRHCNKGRYRTGVFCPLLTSAFDMRFPLIQTTRPVLFEQARERAICEQAPFSLAGRAVVALVLCINDPLDGRTAGRAWLAVSSVYGHLRPKCCDLRRKVGSCFRTQPVDPFRERALCRNVQPG